MDPSAGEANEVSPLSSKFSSEETQCDEFQGSTVVTGLLGLCGPARAQQGTLIDGLKETPVTVK